MRDQKRPLVLGQRQSVNRLARRADCGGLGQGPGEQARRHANVQMQQAGHHHSAEESGGALKQGEAR